MLLNGFKINKYDKCIYTKYIPKAYVLICLYVDNKLIISNSHDIIINTQKMLQKYFVMKDMDVTSVILEIKISKTSDRIILSQSHSIQSVLWRFNVYEESLMKTLIDLNLRLIKNKGESVSELKYSQVIGSLMYTTNCTWSNIAYAVNKFGRFTSNPRNDHWKTTLNRFPRYLRYTLNFGLYFTKYSTLLEGYCDEN